MRVYGQVALRVTKDLDQRQQLADLLAQLDDTAVDTANTFHSGLLKLAADASDVVVPFGSVTKASLLVIVAYQDVTVKLDGTGSPALPVRIVPAAAAGLVSNLQKFDQPGVVFWRGAVSSVHLGNPSSTTEAEVFVAVVGDAT